jgi:rhodanese-related sulfurtransferase
MPVLPKEVSHVSTFAPIAPVDAVAHFSRLLSLETDCWDVHYAMENKKADFVLLDVRAPESYSAGHVPGAVNLPHARISARNLASSPEDTLFVVYCNGPHCNGADRAALNLAKLGRSVKKMIGGIEGWKDEGFKLAQNGSAEGGRDESNHTSALS